MSQKNQIVTGNKFLVMVRGVSKRNWLIAAGAFVALIAFVAVVSLANGGGSSIAGNSSTGSATPAGAQVLEIGGAEGPNGSALLNARDSSLTALNVQFLQFGDEESIPAALAAGTGNAAIVPESAQLIKGQVVIAKLYVVESGGSTGVQVLIAPKDSPLKADLKTLAKALQSQATLDYLNGVDGVKVSQVK